VTARGRCIAVALAALASCSRVRKAERPEPAAPTPSEERPSAKGGVPPRGGRPRVPASPDALLGEGAVERVQRALAGRKLLGEHEQGELDAPTSAALRKFQQEEGLAATGFPDRETLRRLGIDPEASYGKAEEKPR
jgi:hypothetical protein